MSSLAFVFVAVLVYRSARTDRQPWPTAMHGVSTYTGVYALSLAIIGIGSAFYHASLTFIGQFFDVLGMYLIATFVVLYAVNRIRRMHGGSVVASYLAANGVLAWMLYAYPAARRYAFAAVLFAGLGVEYLARQRTAHPFDRKYLLRAVLLLAAGFAFWVVDLTRALCAPHSLLQGHALWHLLGAAGSWQLFAYYRSAQSPLDSHEVPADV